MAGSGRGGRWEGGNAGSGREAKMGERQCWETGYAGRWWEAEGVLEKVGEMEKIVSKERCKYTVN